MSRAGKLRAGVFALLMVGLGMVSVSSAWYPLHQETVVAEAIGQANLRGGPGVDYPVVGEIVTGDRYPVQARHAIVPWLRLDVPHATSAEAWVYADLVTVTGNLAAVPAVSDYPPLVTAAPTARSASSPAPAETPADVPTMRTTATATIAPTPTATISGPLAVTLGEANIRFGPDVSYPVIVKVQAGRAFRVLERHALVPWTHIALDTSPTGTGWLYNDVIEISGDTGTIPITNVMQYNFPTLTPTPPTIVVSSAPWTGAAAPSGELANQLGASIHGYLLQQGFAPFSEQLASVFVMDLRSGDSFSINDGVAYSGMSLTKIPILAAYFQQNDGPLSADQAFLVADTMMCSENITTNQLLEEIGQGNPLRGAQRVTGFMQSLGLNGTFIMRQYVLRDDEPPVGVGTITTSADQISARPDQYNQIVPRDLGWLLASIYQCAADETGLLIERYPDDFDTQKCRRMLHAMDGNEIGVFLEAGVPAGTTVIHKHGWIDDTHGDAGLVIGPDGAYVFVTALYMREWLDFDISSTVIAEMARMTWNALYPDQPLAVTTAAVVPAECDPRSDPVMSSLMSNNLPMPGR